MRKRPRSRSRQGTRNGSGTADGSSEEVAKLWQRTQQEALAAEVTLELWEAIVTREWPMESIGDFAGQQAIVADMEYLMCHYEEK